VWRWAQVGTGLPSRMSFAQRVRNVVTYAAVSAIDYFAFHRHARTHLIS
jgi:hypothetical protein